MKILFVDRLVAVAFGAGQSFHTEERESKAMMSVTCPWCGPREENEFRCIGLLAERPEPSTASDAQWTTFLYGRPTLPTADDGQKVVEWWSHVHGCGQWFRLRRDLLTQQLEGWSAPEQEAIGD